MRQNWRENPSFIYMLQNKSSNIITEYDFQIVIYLILEQLSSIRGVVFL